MANLYNDGTNPKIQKMLDTISQMMGVSFDFTNSASMRVTIESSDGQTAHIRATPLDRGDSLRTTFVPGSEVDVPSGGAADIDGEAATGSLVASKLDLTIPDPSEGGEAVPSDAILYAMATSPLGVAKAVHAERLSATQVRVASDGPGYAGPLEMDTVLATLIAGTLDVTTAVAPLATDLLFIEEISSGGSAADHFSAFRLDATDVTIQAHDAAGALVAGNTSVVRVHKIAAGMNHISRKAATLVAGVGNVTQTNAVGERLLVREVTAGGTAANHFVAFRIDGTTVRVHAVDVAGALEVANTSVVEVYDVGIVNAANAVLIAGTLDVPMVVDADDRLSVVEVATGGGAANHFSVFRKDADEVTVIAEDIAGDFVVANTSTIRVYNHGQSADETSAIRLLVERP